MLVEQKPDRQRRDKRRGFSLIESLVALAIAGGVLSAYYQAVSTSMDLERGSRIRTEAALVAAELVEQVGSKIPLEPGVFEGQRAKGIVWRLQILPGATLTPATARASPDTSGLYQVEIEISGPNLRNAYRLTTLRVGPGTLR